MNSLSNDFLHNFVNNNYDKINDWLINKYQSYKPVFYNSIDLRNSGFKIAPVDNNLFPSGFNNFDHQEILSASSLAKSFLNKHYPRTKNIVIIPEEHTRNLFYLDNLHNIQTILKTAGFHTYFALPTIKEAISLESYSKHNIVIEPFIITNNKITPDIILLNNDLSTLNVDFLDKIKTPIIPTTDLGWNRRKKSTHFEHYNNVCNEFSKEFDIDSFFINCIFDIFHDLDIANLSSKEQLAQIVSNSLNQIQEKYDEHSIKDKPFVYIKAENGTYGMGIITTDNPEQILTINKKNRQKLSFTRNNNLNSKVIIQEGVKSINKINNHTAEPMSYLINGTNFGIRYRYHNKKDELNSLNSPGMSFAKKTSDKYSKAVQVISRLSNIAAAMELEDLR